MGFPADPRHAWSFAVVPCAIAVTDRVPVAPAVPAKVTEIGDNVLALFGSVPDGQSDQGTDHAFAAVLALAVAAVVAGMKGYPANRRWVEDVPPAVPRSQ
jgi:hypothetical protein